MDNILDNLLSDNDSSEEIFSDDIAIPKRCANCKTSVVCSIVPTFMNISKIRVYVSIDQCPYYQPLKNATIRKINKNN